MLLFGDEILECGFHGYVGVVALAAAALLFLYVMLSLKDLIHIKIAIFCVSGKTFKIRLIIADNCFYICFKTGKILLNRSYRKY